jgi:hypothetical protein
MARPVVILLHIASRLPLCQKQKSGHSRKTATFFPSDVFMELCTLLPYESLQCVLAFVSSYAVQLIVK